MKNPEARVQNLREEIEEHRYRYYVLDDPAISDGAYDGLVRELEELEAAHPHLRDSNSPTQRVGAKPLEGFGTVAHTQPMLSLNDAFSIEELQAWYLRIQKLAEASPTLHMDIKMDGLAATLVYEDGELSYGATRGDGYQGEDVTQNMRTIGSVPLRLREPAEGSLAGRIEIRGEVLIYADDFIRINQERETAGEALYANPRNLAAGSIRQLDPKLAAARPLRFHAYRVLTSDPLPSLEREYRFAREVGFIVNSEAEIAQDMNEVERYVQKWESERSQLPFGTDGVVISVNERSIFDTLGVVGKAPRGAIAFKFPAEQSSTKLREIRVNVGRTGAVTPFAVLDPVKIAGTTVQMATLHNAGEIARKDIRAGDTVIVQKAGDIIPEVVESLPDLRDGSEEVFVMPAECPVCGGRLQKQEQEAVWRCTNQNCPARTHRLIEHFVSRGALDIDGVGERIVKVLLENELITDSADLFTLGVEQIAALEGFKEVSARNIIEAIEAAKSPPLDRFIFALGIRHVGRQTAIDLANRFRSIENLRTATLDELADVEGIGEVVAESIAAWFADENNQKLLDKFISSGVQPQPPEETPDKSLEGQTFVITGTLSDMSREEAAEAVRSRGGKITSGVTSQTDYLVVGEKPGGSKVTQAKEHGTRQLDETTFQQLLS